MWPQVMKLLLSQASLDSTTYSSKTRTKQSSCQGDDKNLQQSHQTDN